ncbi:hypothetical protein [Desulfonauticus submarinus]
MMIYIISNNYILNQVKRSFEGSGLNSDVINFFYYFIIFCILFSPILFLIHLYVKRRESRYDSNEFGSISDKETIKNIFDFALIQRSRFDISIRRSDSMIYATLVDYDDEFIYLEMPSYLKISKVWFKKNLSCFFKIGSGKLNAIFYNFKSIVVDYYVDKGSYIIKLKLPEKLYLGQKRRFLRIEIPSKYIKSIKLWSASLDKYAGFSKDISEWGVPLGLYDERKRSIFLKDISGGGIKLGIKKKIVSDVVKFKRDNEYIFLYLHLNPTYTNSNMFFYFICKLKNVYQVDDPEFYFFGFQFVAEGKVKANSTQIEWKEIPLEQGCESLGNWLFEKYLEIYRQKGTV